MLSLSSTSFLIKKVVNYSQPISNNQKKLRILNSNPYRLRKSQTANAHLRRRGGGGVLSEKDTTLPHFAT